MRGYPGVPREDERYGAARVVGRSRLFFIAPIIIIVVISANFAWEIIKINLSPHLAAEWPFRFTILDAPASAGILAVFIGLFMGRLQWARALRPTIGCAIDDESVQFRRESEVWRFWLYNAGPGGAVIDSVMYHVRFVDQDESDDTGGWVPISAMNQRFRSRNLIDGVDYFVRWFAHGAPFPTVSTYSDGTKNAWFTTRALAELRILDIKVRFTGSLGDSYEKIIPIMQRMPSVVVAAIREARLQSAQTP